MSSALEPLVRPFQTRQVSYPARVFDTTARPDDDVLLELGKEGATKLFNESFSENVTTYTELESKETKREVQKKRITNPDDDSQFVDVELIKKLSVEQGTGRTYQKINYQFNNT